MSSGINWRNHFIELIVVIVGVTIAFALTNWQEGKRESKIRDEYLQSLVSDLEEDQSELELYIDTIYYYQKNTKALIGAIYTQNFSNDTLILNGIISLYIQFAFSPQDGSYNTMIASGQLRLLGDLDIQKSIMNLYESYYDDLINVDKIIQEQNFTIKQPYFNENIRYGRGGVQNKEILKESTMINLAHSSDYFWAQKLELYQDALERNQKLTQTIKEKLNDGTSYD